jgi:SulP family sulfate permease
MILISGLDPLGLLFSVGLFYILSGLYFGITVPVQPMKVIGAYAIATGIGAPQVLAAGAMIGLFLLFVGWTGAVSAIGKYTPTPVIRGVQLSTGALLMMQGVKLMLGTSQFQILQNAPEPYLTLQTIGPIPVGVIIGIIGILLTFLLLDNKKLPSGLIIVLGGIALGGVWGTHHGFDQLRIGFYLPKILPNGFPAARDFIQALPLLLLPQIPMTLGNAVIAYTDLSDKYFGASSKKVTYKSCCISMAIANLVSFCFGGMPLCHGAGGLAAHYRFGARTAGSNFMIGVVFLGLAVFLGRHALAVIHLIPMSILGVLLLFAGSQLALTLVDLKKRKDFFIALVMLGITLASNLAAGFVSGMIIARIIKSEKVSV